MRIQVILKNRIVRVSNLIRFFDEKYIRFNPPGGYNSLSARGAECCKQDCWVRIELLSDKDFFNNPSNYYDFQEGTKWNIEKVSIK